MCFRGGNLYRKERKKRTKLDLKPVAIKPVENPVAIEPVENPVDEESMVEDVIEPLPSIPNVIIRLPKRKLPDLDMPDILKYHTGYNCHLVYEKNAVRNSNWVGYFFKFICL